ncbi:MAG: GNAT family N-acetyltransferase [Alphaproteobacteria bacterium]|nr:MAG: GNAT family N-acetyltransferase [Alphaproteobacteria bacterium]
MAMVEDSGMKDRDGSAPADSEDVHLTLRNLRLSDYDDLKAIMTAVYPGMPVWTRKEIATLLKAFPEGQICIEDDGRVVGVALAVIIDYAKFGHQHTYAEIAGDASLSSHDPDGDVLYGVDVFVDPDYTDMRFGRRLYDARKELCRNLNLRAIVAGGRMPGYRAYADKISPQEYVEKVRAQEIYDPIITFQLANDFQVRRVLPEYLPEDKDSRGYATLLEWTNIYYEPADRPLLTPARSSARIGVVQWQMRTMHSFDEFLTQVEFFVDSLADYNADVAMFPEFFTAPLMALEPAENTVEAVRNLARYTERTRDALSSLAVSYNINIIGGSLPVLEDGELYNVAYLCRRDGTVDSQSKLHITPSEWRYWAMRGGDQIRVFETDFGRIGILICYDVQFPELSRLLAEKGMQILFVPFWTDTKNGYLRVKRCAQARAIENECYVAIGGSVGNLPRVENADIQYAQSAVFSPSDFAFPHDAIMAETTPNTEMTLIVDVDLDKLKMLHNEGSVRNLKDRRLDLYGIDWIGATAIDGDT